MRATAPAEFRDVGRTLRWDSFLAQGIAWKRITAEGIAIVVSILLAFAIDAAWDESRERAQERRALRGLQEEFTENLRLLETNLDGHRSTLRATTALLALSDEEFEELVAMRAYGAEILIDENEALKEHLQRIVARLDGS